MRPGNPVRDAVARATWWRDHLRSRRLANSRVDKRLMIARIQATVADHWGISLDELLGPRTAVRVARPRMAAMYLARALTCRSLPDIGRMFGGRDHSTVINAIQRIETLRGVDRDLDQSLITLADRLRQ